MDCFLYGFADELSSGLIKEALRAGGKLIAALFGKGGPGATKLLKKRGYGHLTPGSTEAMAVGQRLSKKTGVMKMSPQASQLGRRAHLGVGQEGVSTLVADPKFGVHVRKVKDPKGASTRAGVRAQEEAARTMRDVPGVAKLLGARTTKGGLREQRWSYVPGKSLESMGVTLAKGTPKSTTGLRTGKLGKGTPRESAVSREVEKTKRIAARRGVPLKDVHAGNVNVPEEGRGVVTDFLAKPKGMKGPFIDEKKLEAAERAASKGLSTPYIDYLSDPRRPGSVMARAYRGAPPLVPGTSPKVAPHTMAELERVKGVQAAAAAATRKKPRGKRGRATELTTGMGSGPRATDVAAERVRSAAKAKARRAAGVPAPSKTGVVRPSDIRV
jgi:hypothetical protein